jgi:hypothetical protein
MRKRVLWIFLLLLLAFGAPAIREMGQGDIGGGLARLLVLFGFSYLVAFIWGKFSKKPAVPKKSGT